jgi:hypothetical protein
MIINGREVRPANDEMIEGYRDGFDLTAPEPSANRSNSYRHGFFVARIDKGVINGAFHFGELDAMADRAMMLDESR